MKITITLYSYLKFELERKGLNDSYEYDDTSLMTKILMYDDDISEIMNRLFAGMGLDNKHHDEHFKKYFLYRFMNRQINRQTVGSFKMELLSTFLSNQDFINRIYKDMDLYLEQKQVNKDNSKQKNKQDTDGSSTTDNRSAFADLPQSSTNLDVDNTNMDYATDNTISRNRQKDKQETEGLTIGSNRGESRSYQLDELFKTSGILEKVLNEFDKKCFLQVW